MPLTAGKVPIATAADACRDATAAELTALCNAFTQTLKGLVAAPVTVTGKFLRDDGTWAVPSDGLVDTVFGRVGDVVAAQDDYTFAQINKTVSSLGDLTTRSASDLSSGTLSNARLSASVPLLGQVNNWGAFAQQFNEITSNTSLLYIRGRNGNAPGVVGEAILVSGGLGNAGANGGSLTLQGGATGVGATGNAGPVYITGGYSESTNGNGGFVDIDGGVKTGTGTAGAVTIGTARAASVTIGRTGINTTINGTLRTYAIQGLDSSLEIIGLDVTGASTGGDILISGGSTATGFGGAINILTGNASGAGGAGALTLDTGGANGGASGTISIGPSSAGSIQIGNAGGSLTVNMYANALTLADDSVARMTFQTGQAITLSDEAGTIQASFFSTQNTIGTVGTPLTLNGLTVIIDGRDASAGNTAGGTVAITSGNGFGIADGGLLSLTGGNSGAGAAGDGGAVSILAGDAVSTNGSGGALNIDAGAKTGAGTAGVITIGGTNASSVIVGRAAGYTTIDGFNVLIQSPVLYLASSGGANVRLTYSDGADLQIKGELGTTKINVTEAGTMFSGSIGFYGTAVQAQQAVAALTNSVTAGGVNDTIANYTDLTTYANDAAAIRNDIYQLARKLSQVVTALRLYGLFS